MNKVKIKVLSIKDHGRFHNQWCDRVLMLRTARKVGDVEVVNHTQLSALKRMESEISFEIIRM